MQAAAFPPAVQILIEAGRLSLHGTNQATPVADRDAWLASPHAAERHGMSAWLAAALRQWPDAPSSVGEQVQAAARVRAVQALHGAAELAGVVAHLRQAGIEPVALKGPLFSQWLYGDLGARRFADLDLLVSHGERGRAVEVLRTAGYSLAGGMPLDTARVIYGGLGAWPLAGANTLPLDLHWRLQASGFGPLPGVAEVLRDSIVVSHAGTTVRIPGPTHAATLTIVHAAKHLWASLELLFSLAHLLRRDDVDWMCVRALAMRTGSWNGAVTGLVLAADIFACDMPAPLRDLPLPRNVSRLLPAARAFLSMPDVAEAPRRAEIRAHLAALDTPFSRLRYLAWRLAAPTPLEWSWCWLPERFAGLYVGVRIVRLTVAGLRGVGGALLRRVRAR